MYRQGDILIVAATEKDAQEAEQKGEKIPRENEQIILAYGESTGHAHAIKDLHVEMIDVAGRQILCASAPFTVVHEEHDSIQIPAGLFRVIRQREYSPMTGFVAISD